MSVLLVIGMGVVLWLGLCLLLVALCRSAKEGDGQLASSAPSGRYRSPALS